MSKSRFSHAAGFGAAAGIGVIAIALIIYLAALPEWLNNISYIVLLALLCIGAKKWRDENGGYLTFGGTYKYLMLASLVYAVMMSVWVVIFSVYIAPGLIEDRMLIEQAKMEDKGMSAEEVAMAMKFARMFTQPAMLVVFTLTGGMIFYALLNLILAAIMKKDPPPAQFMPPGNYPNVPSPERFPNAPQNTPYPNQHDGNNPQGNSPFQPPTNFPPQQ
jgi:hypothetical protein